jgi:hypothetical protein
MASSPIGSPAFRRSRRIRSTGSPCPVVDRGRAQFTSLVQPLGYAVDNVDFGHAFEQRAIGREEAEVARAKHPNRAPGADRGELGGMPSGDERIGERHEVVLTIVAGVTRHRDAVGVGEWHPQQFGLRSAVGTHPGVAVGRAEPPGSYPQAGRGVAAGAVDAGIMAANDHSGERGHHRSGASCLSPACGENFEEAISREHCTGLE